MTRLAIFILCASAATIHAQKFEVASIKPSAPGEQGILYHYPGARLRTTGMTVKYLIEYAYSVTDRQLLGGPDWLDTARFDIDAKPETAPADKPDPGEPENNERIRNMLRALLADRFHLQIRSEQKELPVYALVVAPGGPKMTKNTDEPYTMTNRTNGVVRAMGQAKWGFTKTTMSQLAADLSGQVAAADLERQVIDKTNLSGEYDFILKWLTAANEMKAAADPKFGGPSIFTAIQEQLGLKLQPDKAPVEVMVIDHLEQPSAN
jgi:uncharacterized protein (TIGR03435 family)